MNYTQKKINQYFSKTESTAPLAVFRFLFGAMMFFSILRFWEKGWIDSLYIAPKFHFSYYGFEWVKPIGGYTYLIFIVCAFTSLMVAIGFKYRIAITTFFLSFTYIELMDKTTYLNHYYFISLVSFLLIFLPANKYFSIDSYIEKKEYKKTPRWTVDCLKLMIGIVYVYAGVAKLNSDWLFQAMPLKIWLTSKYDLPLLGGLMQKQWFHYAMSWSGMLYDLTIPFLLLYKKTRLIAFLLVIIFHVFTGILFPIGMFPYIMIVGSLLFFDASFHEKILKKIKNNRRRIRDIELIPSYVYSAAQRKVTLGIMLLFFMVQLIIPWRYLLYPGELFWTEQGYRFSWRVMLMEKVGYTIFKIVDGKTKKFFYVENNDFLTPIQEKQMSFQPDFILEYAHYLGNHFKRQGHKNVEVYAESYVALNGRLSMPFVKKSVDLMKQNVSFKHKDWIIPFKHEVKIRGL